MTDNTRLWVLP